VREVVRLAEVLARDRGEDEPPRDPAGLLVERNLLARREHLRRLVRERRLLGGAGVAEVGDGEGDDTGREDETGQE
jgi:hypothetical protein